MTREDAILHMTLRREELKHSVSDLDEDIKAFDMAIQALEQEPCEMTAEEYRQRMIQAFHNADCGELIAVCVLPTAKEFEFLEWLLKNHYKKEPCDDAISRQAVLDGLGKYHDGADLHIDGLTYAYDLVCKLPSVSTEKTGRWEKLSVCYGCSECSLCTNIHGIRDFKYCPNCGAKMEVRNDERRSV